MTAALEQAEALPARIGLVEALAEIPSKKVQKPILAIAKDEDEDEELRKTAWRSLRKNRRRIAALERSKEVSP